ncbi:MAG: cation-translocating P-type ATPase [Clostridiales bacterium]|nr:cation-translocating P-type ATPase [Clostridiales bacterium]
MDTSHIKDSFSKSADEVVNILETDKTAGLTAEEASKRLAQFGKNSLGEEKKVPLWKRFLAQFADAMVIILIVAAGLSAVMAYKEGGMEGWIDVFVILAIIILNAVLGVYQEGKADQALAALKKMSSPKTKVIRDGAVTVIDSEDMVPGDIVSIDAGDSIAADIRLITSSSLKAEEASLTGESVPVDKNADEVLSADCSIGDRSNMLFMGTAVTYGRATGVVIGTARNTELGKIANKLTNMQDEETPLKKSLDKLGKILAVVCIIVCVLVFIVDLVVQKIPWNDALMTAVSLAVAAIPEGLAAVVTIVLSIGMTRMAKNRAVVKRLLAVETLGCVDVICSDKTGTLTQNQMTVKAMFDGKEMYKVEGNGYAPEGHLVDADGAQVTPGKVCETLIRAGVLCNDAAINKTENGEYICIGDPTEGALTTLGNKLGQSREETNAKYKRIAELPFDSDRKMMTTYHSGVVSGKVISYTKGAPDIIFSRCTAYLTEDGVKDMTPEVLKRISKVNNDYASGAIRVLAFAYREFEEGHENAPVFDDETNMIFIGLIGMIDPARTEARDAIAVCKKAGIRTVMITGDYKLSAAAIADNLGMLSELQKETGTGAMSGEELDRVTDEEMVNVCEVTNVYARVSPEHKVRIVEALKKNGHIASMTGDGVNDAMALKAADIGVAMGITGTDVSKNAADMILMDDNFATIVKAVEEGRIIYSNIRKFIGFLLSCNVGEILIIFLISLIPNSLIPGLAAPLTAIQLLLLNLVTDSFPALALGREAGEPDIMNLPPRRADEPIINGKMKATVAVQALAIFLAVGGAFLLTLTGTLGFVGLDGTIEVARTVALATLVCAELFRAYAARSERVSVFKLGLFSNKMMNASVGISLMILLAVIYIPGVNRVFDNVAISPMSWLLILPIALIPFAAGEIHKLISSRLHK